MPEFKKQSKKEDLSIKRDKIKKDLEKGNLADMLKPSDKLDEAKSVIQQKKLAFEEKIKELSQKDEATVHTVVANETLSHIALKYYGKATPPYYQHIYNHNRDVIGDNINIILPGQKLVIPELPEDLK